MALYSRIEKQIEETVKSFCKTLAEKFEGLKEEQLLKIWKEHVHTKKPRRSNKKSGYHQFQKTMFPKIKEEQPDLKFGDIAKLISGRWKEMTVEEKKDYSPPSKSTPTTPTTKSTPTPTTKSTPISTPQPVSSPIVSKASKKMNKSKSDASLQDTYEERNVKDLKKLCKERGVSIKGLVKKSEFVDLLRKLDQETKVNPSDDVGENDDSNDDDDGSTFSHQLLEEEEDNLLA